MDLNEARRLILFDDLHFSDSLSGLVYDEQSIKEAYLLVFIDTLMKRSNNPEDELSYIPPYKRNELLALKKRPKKTYKKVHYVIRALDEKNNKWINVEQTSTDNFQNATKKARHYRNKHNQTTDIVLVAETTITVTEEHNTGVSFARSVKDE